MCGLGLEFCFCTCQVKLTMSPRNCYTEKKATGEKQKCIFCWKFYRRKAFVNHGGSRKLTPVTNCFLPAAVDPGPQDSLLYVYAFDSLVGVHLGLFVRKDISIIQLTIDSERNLFLPCSHTRDHSTANVFASVLLSHRFQCQEVLIAQNLQQEKKKKEKLKIIKCIDSRGTFTFEKTTRKSDGRKKERQHMNHLIP